MEDGVYQALYDDAKVCGYELVAEDTDIVRFAFRGHVIDLRLQDGGILVRATTGQLLVQPRAANVLLLTVQGF